MKHIRPIRYVALAFSTIAIYMVMFQVMQLNIAIPACLGISTALIVNSIWELEEK